MDGISGKLKMVLALSSSFFAVNIYAMHAFFFFNVNNINLCIYFLNVLNKSMASCSNNKNISFNNYKNNHVIISKK